MNVLKKRLEKEGEGNDVNEKTKKNIKQSEVLSKEILWEQKVQRAKERKKLVKLEMEKRRTRRPPNYLKLLGLECVMEMKEVVKGGEGSDIEEKERERKEVWDVDEGGNNKYLSSLQPSYNQSPCFSELTEEEQKEIMMFEKMTERINKPIKDKCSFGVYVLLLL
jgi:hypothetical protein